MGHASFAMVQDSKQQVPRRPTTTSQLLADANYGIQQQQAAQMQANLMRQNAMASSLQNQAQSMMASNSNMQASAAAANTQASLHALAANKSWSNPAALAVNGSARPNPQVASVRPRTIVVRCV
jgi:hypothetical protein